MNENFMKEKPVLPLILSMSLPMVLSMMVNSLYNIVDSFFVAQISEDAMTALSLVYPVQNFVNAIGIGFGIGINAVIAIHLGAGDEKKANMATTQGMLLALIHAVILTVAGIAVMPGFLRMFTSSEKVIDLGIRYSVIVFLFTFAIVLGVAFEKVFQAVGAMKVTMLSLMCGCIANIILDPVLIFGANGRLVFYNKAYLSLWKADEVLLQSEPGIDEIIEAQAKFFANVDDWAGLKKDIIKHLTSLTTKSFSLKRSDGASIEVLTAVLSDGSIMITYKQI